MQAIFFSFKHYQKKKKKKINYKINQIKHHTSNFIARKQVGCVFYFI